MEAPIAVAVLLEISHGIAATHQHVADIQLKPNDRRVHPLEKYVVGNLAVDRFHVVRLVVKREPDSRGTGSSSGGVEPIGPLSPGVERVLRLGGQARYGEI